MHISGDQVIKFSEKSLFLLFADVDQREKKSAKEKDYYTSI